MYAYNQFDRDFLAQRNRDFRALVQRRLDGSLTEEEFKPLRLMNGLYLMLHAYMLRVAIPYGTLRSAQMRQLADIADRFDRGYGHFTTRQNIQFNWPKLAEVPDILDALAEVDMHAVQSSGACIRNVTSDHFAGAAADEMDDPRPTAELIRQWSTDHPEYAFLPRKFKIAVTGSKNDRAATRFHDVGLRLLRDDRGQPGYQVSVGGGLGRTPMIGRIIRNFLPKADLLPYLEAILQVYNAIGRRDNKYKARIKITLHEHSLESLKSQIEQRYLLQRASFGGADQQVLKAIETDFASPEFSDLSDLDFQAEMRRNPVFRSFVDTNTTPHRHAGYAIVTVSLKAHGQTPGDASSDQMRAVAKLAEAYGYDEIRVSHEQNLVLPHVAKAHLPLLYAGLKAAGLASANVGRVSDIIACPGMDYCDLATARSIPVAQEIATRFQELKLEHDIGLLQIKISGCINACGHHHIGHIGILGLEKAGAESYQITLGGDATQTPAIGQRVGPGFSASEILPAIERLIHTYLELRQSPDESFHQAFIRLTMVPFKRALYPTAEVSHAA